MIKQEGDKWVLYSKDGNKKLGEFDTEDEAEIIAAQAAKESAGVANVVEAVPDYSDHAMVALYPPPEIAAALALDAGQFPDRIEPEDLHVTLIYLGEIADMQAEKETIMNVLAQIAGTKPLLQAHINGAGRFADVGEEGRTAFYANVDCKELPGLRQRLVDDLEWVDAKSPSRHGFTPHVTLAYLSTDVPTPDIRPLVDVTFDAIYLKWGEERISFDLQGQVDNPAPEPPILASERKLSDVWDRSLTEAKLDDAGNLSGVIVVEGESANGNIYTKAALESGVEIFAGKPIYADHPTRSEMRERPERSVRDLVGRLPGAEHIFVEALSPTDSRLALKYRNGRLSESAHWLATLIREGIAGDQSINADGSGYWLEADTTFQVESFTGATSLDFVTVAAAGGQGFLESQQRTPTEALAGLTLKDLAEARPDILDDIASRERRKAYGEKRELGNLREVLRMTQNGNDNLAQRVTALETRNAKLERERRMLRASAIVDEALKEQPSIIRRRVRKLIESTQRAFVEQDGAPSIAPEPPGELAPASPDAQAGDPPKIELPPDAAQLPDAAQAIFLETYTAHIAEGEEMATHKAWAAVNAAGWIKDESSGQWGKIEPEVTDDEMGGEAPAETETAVTEESLAKTVARLIKEERDDLAALTGAGDIHGMGGAPPDETVDAEAQHADLVRTFKESGMSEAQAKLAAAGRPRQGA